DLIDKTELIDIHRDFRIEYAFQRLDDPGQLGVAEGRLQRRRLGFHVTDGVVHHRPVDIAHTAMSSLAVSFMALSIVCQASVAHFTRIGYWRTPARIIIRSAVSSSRSDRSAS